MKRTFNFGKIAAYGNRKINLVTVEVELSEKTVTKYLQQAAMFGTQNIQILLEAVSVWII